MADLRALARAIAKQQGVNPDIFEAQIQQESGFNRNARSPAGAQGIAQFMPATAKGYGVNLNDNRVTDDLEGAARYMAENLKRTGGNYHQALSIYNSGKPEGYKSIAETRNYVDTILSGKHPGASTTSNPSSLRRVTSSVMDKAGYDQALKKAALAQYITKRNPNSALLRTGAISPAAPDPGAFTSQVTTTIPGESSGGGAGASDLVARANTIDQQRLPYKWGGGHQGKTPIAKAVPLDCSGAVSKVLGINPRVASEFKQWGKPGEGGEATIYAKDTHVLMKIRGLDDKYHFFGTSGSNPGGGAGWIPASQISRDYLSGFTARHI